MDDQQMNVQKEKSGAKGVVSFILGILSILCSCVVVFSLPLSITGLVLGVKSKVKNGFSKAGTILSGIGLGLSIIILVIILILLGMGKISYFDNKKQTFTGDGFTLQYDNKWSRATLKGGKDALEYRKQGSYISPIGKSLLSEADPMYDLSTTEGQMKLYDDFYTYWSNNDDRLNVYGGSNGFDILKDDIYYATYDYGVSEDKIVGKFIVLVSAEKNVVLSFTTNHKNDVEKNDERAIELLKSIEIESCQDQKNMNSEESTEDMTEDITEDITEDTTVIEDEENENTIRESLNALLPWNQYAELREGNRGSSKDINGGWRILSDSEVYWEFKDGEFWWYKSINDLNDNYWYGTTDILSGEEGLKVAGLDVNKVKDICDHSDGKVTPEDIYTIVCKPSKIISGGEDKSATNMDSDTAWTLIWIIVDHGEDGIEGQVLNLSNYEQTYYVKVLDK